MNRICELETAKEFFRQLQATLAEKRGQYIATPTGLGGAVGAQISGLLEDCTSVAEEPVEGASFGGGNLSMLFHPELVFAVAEIVSGGS